jgi:REP element-mobilizing transposase RayT
MDCLQIGFEQNMFVNVCCLLVKAAVSMKNHVHLMRVRLLQKMSVKIVMAMLRGRKRIRRILQYLQRLLQNLVS